MLLFSRAVTLRGSPRQVLPWVQQVTAHVNANSSLDVTAWNADFGQPIGTVVWNALVESQQALADGTSALLGDESYHEVLEAAADMVVAPGEDTLRNLVHGSPSEPPGVGSIAAVTQAAPVVDRMGDTLAWSVEMAEYVSQLTGVTMSVWVNSFGQMGGITWIATVDGPTAADAMQGKLQGDPGYFERLQASEGLFIPGSGEQARFTRML